MYDFRIYQSRDETKHKRYETKATKHDVTAGRGLGGCQFSADVAGVSPLWRWGGGVLMGVAVDDVAMRGVR
jgi:hypothetical protein